MAVDKHIVHNKINISVLLLYWECKWDSGIVIYMTWKYLGRFSFEDVNLRSVNGTSPINIRDCYGKISELVAFHYAFKICSGRESNSTL